MASDIGVTAPVVYRPLEPAVSWGAIFAGAATALALSIFLNLLAAGFGLKFMAPAFMGAGTRNFTPELGAWMIAAQVVSTGLGGFIAGRLRGAWAGVHDDEAHFRDTAHGVVVWALTTIAGGFVLGPMLMSATNFAAQLAPVAPEDAARAANLAAQAAFFAATGLLLSGFIAAVAARIGGMHGETLRRPAV